MDVDKMMACPAATSTKNGITATRNDKIPLSRESLAIHLFDVHHVPIEMDLFTTEQNDHEPINLIG